MISILIPAYKAEDFIEECLDSLNRQDKGIDFEVIIGIDGCETTENKILEIKHKYESLNLKIIKLIKNSGVYITINTLLGLVEGEYILRFDSDDHLDDNAIYNISKYLEYDIIRFKCYDYSNNNSFKRVVAGPHDGIFCAKKRVYDDLGGYKPWLCAADTDFRYRLKNRYSEIIIPEIIYHRRIHPNSLTTSPETSYHSELRNKYRRDIGNGNIKITPEIAKYKIIK